MEYCTANLLSLFHYSKTHYSAQIVTLADSARFDQTRPTCPMAVAGLIILYFVALLAFQIPKGILTNTNELLTAERSREMLLTDPWVVHFNFKRSFQKPPLQYWLTTPTLSRFENRTLAVRIWPVTYGVLTLMDTVWLAFLTDPTRSWLIPLTAAILVSCPLFSSEAGRGLLDIGLTFYTTIAIVFAQLARKHSAWSIQAENLLNNTCFRVG